MVAINKSETKKNGGQSGNRESSSRFNNLWNTKVTIVLIVSGTLGVTLRKGWKNIEIQGLPRGLWRRWIITVTISVKTGGGEMISYNRSRLLAFLLREVFHCCRCRHPIIGIFIFFSYSFFLFPFSPRRWRWRRWQWIKVRPFAWIWFWRRRSPHTWLKGWLRQTGSGKTGCLILSDPWSVKIRLGYASPNGVTDLRQFGR